MILPLSERIRNHQVEATEKCFTERTIEPLLQLFKEYKNTTAYAYPHSASIYINVWEDNKKADEELLPLIAKLYPKAEWDRRVLEGQVIYDISFDLEDIQVSIMVTFNQLGPGCSIVKIPTGKTRRVMKSIEVEEIDYTYDIRCEEEHLEDAEVQPE